MPTLIPSLGVLQTQPLRTPPRPRFVGMNKQSRMQTHGAHLGQLSVPPPPRSPKPRTSLTEVKLDKTGRVTEAGSWGCSIAEVGGGLGEP